MPQTRGSSACAKGSFVCFRSSHVHHNQLLRLCVLLKWWWQTAIMRSFLWEQVCGNQKALLFFGWSSNSGRWLARSGCLCVLRSKASSHKKSFFLFSLQCAKWPPTLRQTLPVATVDDKARPKWFATLQTTKARQGKKILFLHRERERAFWQKRIGNKGQRIFVVVCQMKVKCEWGGSCFVAERKWVRRKWTGKGQKRSDRTDWGDKKGKIRTTTADSKTANDYWDVWQYNKLWSKSELGV